MQRQSRHVTYQYCFSLRMSEGEQSLSGSLATGLVGCAHLTPSSWTVEWRVLGSLGCKATASHLDQSAFLLEGVNVLDRSAFWVFTLRLTNWQSSLCVGESLENWDNASPSPRPHHFSKEMTALTIIRGFKQDSVCKVLRLNRVIMSLTLGWNGFLPVTGWGIQEWINIELLYKL